MSANRMISQIARATAMQSAMVTRPMARAFVSSTTPLLEKHTLKVPTMGDSITEGTIVEWTAQIGQLVKEGDVVVLVETDKVTVDIKADMEGVVMQQYGGVDDTIEVGADLYEIDTEATPTVEASDSSQPASAAAEPAPAKPAPAAAAPSSPAPSQPASKHRVPSIKFLGKAGWERKLSGKPETPAVPADYGRPKFSEEEIEALLSGGANLAPDVKQLSSGATFGF